MSKPKIAGGQIIDRVGNLQKLPTPQDGRQILRVLCTAQMSHNISEHLTCEVRFEPMFVPMNIILHPDGI